MARTRPITGAAGFIAAVDRHHASGAPRRAARNRGRGYAGGREFLGGGGNPDAALGEPVVEPRGYPDGGALPPIGGGCGECGGAPCRDGGGRTGDQAGAIATGGPQPFGGGTPHRWDSSPGRHTPVPTTPRAPLPHAGGRAVPRPYPGRSADRLPVDDGGAEARMLLATTPLARGVPGAQGLGGVRHLQDGGVPVLPGREEAPGEDQPRGCALSAARARAQPSLVRGFEAPEAALPRPLALSLGV